ncbi:hypothetical protein AMATHDRAFT_7647 [Amanita thiersii Skay4041]|uniref:Peptidase S8/S53 domain-containing protein n=1 Tax=Amanita thiersii Skay4041 TaxID=703135 RepID=A0A2A9N8B5_9AGAR|nr:hypothetical protein AMATHDRAFT_7647 [Amanita thiersii Skay4041]
MKALHISWLIQVCIALAVADDFPFSSINWNSSSSTVVPNKYLIQFDKSAELFQKRSHGKEQKHHAIVYETLKKRNVKFHVHREFNSEELFMGATVTVEDPRDLAAIENSPGIHRVEPLRILVRPRSEMSIPLARWGPGPNDPLNALSAHEMIGADKLHAKGITGKGIKIGIIDSGIDYTHPLLKDTVVGGWNFVDEHDGPYTLETCGGHGTHVAGIIGAKPGGDFNIKGVAYDASLTAYKVGGCTGAFSEAAVISALLRGVKDRQDILTLSFGQPSGWAGSTLAKLISDIAASGTIVTISAGNAGHVGSWYANGAPRGRNVISVANVQNNVNLVQTAIINGVHYGPIVYQPANNNIFPQTGPLRVFATWTRAAAVFDHACKPLPINLSSFLVVVRVGACPLQQKLDNIAASSGKFALIYDSEEVLASPLPFTTVYAGFITATDGRFLVENFAVGTHITITFPPRGGLVGHSNEFGELVDPSSSYGPPYDLSLQPAVSAPGTDILSTFPRTLEGYGVMSGTSMSTPLVAGSIALLLQAIEKRYTIATDMRTRLETTSQPLPSSHTPGALLQTVTHQGTGMINIHNAIHYKTFVTPGELLLGDTDHFEGSHSITVHNTGPYPQAYNVSHVHAGTAITMQPNGVHPNTGPVPLDSHSASVELSPTNFTLLPNDFVTIVATISPPKGLDPLLFPVFSGFITIKSATENLHVTYMGLDAPLKSIKVIDNLTKLGGVPLPVLIDKDKKVQTGRRAFTMVDGDAPILVYRLGFGAPMLLIDLVAPNIKFRPSMNKIYDDDFQVSPSEPVDRIVETVGNVFRDYWVPRNQMPTRDFPYSAVRIDRLSLTKSAIPNGDYRVLLRVFDEVGDPSRIKPRNSWLSPIVHIRAPRGYQ